MAEKSGRFHARGSGKTLNEGSVSKLELEEYMDMLITIEELFIPVFQTLVRNAVDASVAITYYENLFNETDQTLRQITEWLSIPALHLNVAQLPRKISRPRIDTELFPLNLEVMGESSEDEYQESQRKRLARINSVGDWSTDQTSE